MKLRGILADIHPILQLILFVMLVLGILLFFATSAMLVSILLNTLFDLQLLDVVNLKWQQFLSMVTVFLIPPFLVAYLFSKKPLDWLCLSQKASWKVILPAMVIMLLALPAISLLSHLNQQIILPDFLEPIEAWMKSKEEALAATTKQFLSVKSYGGLVINILLMALLPAIAEELTFRGVLQRLFASRKVHNQLSEGRWRVPHVAIWITAIIFSAIHFQFYGFIPRMLMGALFGYMLVWTGSIWVPMTMHFVNNAMAVILYFVAERTGWDMEKIDAIGAGDTLWLGIVSVILTIVAVVIFYICRRSTTMRSASSRISSGS